MRSILYGARGSCSLDMSHWRHSAMKVPEEAPWEASGHGGLLAARHCRSLALHML